MTKRIKSFVGSAGIETKLTVDLLFELFCKASTTLDSHLFPGRQINFTFTQLIPVLIVFEGYTQITTLCYSLLLAEVNICLGGSPRCCNSRGKKNKLNTDDCQITVANRLRVVGNRKEFGSRGEPKPIAVLILRNVSNMLDT